MLTAVTFLSPLDEFSRLVEVLLPSGSQLSAATFIRQHLKETPEYRKLRHIRSTVLISPHFKENFTLSQVMQAGTGCPIQHSPHST